MPIATAVDLWGPSAWKFLHAIAFSWPEAPDDEQVAQLTKFLDALPDVIPCPSCGLHARQYFVNHQAELTQALRSGPRLQRFMHAFHNAVNASRDPPVPPMDFESVRQIYTDGHVQGRPRPRTQTEWADPYHNMPPWNQQQAGGQPGGGGGSNTAKDGYAPGTAAAAVAVVVASLAYFYYYYYLSAYRRTTTPPPPAAAPAAAAAAAKAAATVK